MHADANGRWHDHDVRRCGFGLSNCASSRLSELAERMAMMSLTKLSRSLAATRMTGSEVPMHLQKQSSVNPLQWI